jgi:hypothetical protein
MLMDDGGLFGGSSVGVLVLLLLLFQEVGELAQTDVELLGSRRVSSDGLRTWSVIVGGRVVIDGFPAVNIKERGPGFADETTVAGVAWEHVLVDRVEDCGYFEYCGSSSRRRRKSGIRHVVQAAVVSDKEEECVKTTLWEIVHPSLFISEMLKAEA